MPRRGSDASRDTVLFVSSWPYLGGGQVSLATALASMRGRVRAVVAAPDNGVLIDRLWDRKLIDEHIVIPNRGISGTARTRLETARILSRWLRENRHRLLAVHANGDSELKLLLPVLPLIRRPVVVWYHSHTLSRSTRQLAPLWRLLARRLVWAPVSESSRHDLRRARITGSRNTSVVYNPVEPAEVVPTNRSRAPRRGFIVGYLGCENVSKGVLVLPEIARRLRGSPVELLCVTKGWPPERNSREVNHALDELRELSPPVTFRLRDHDVRNIYADIDALLVPSLAESFCRIAAEAMLNELPVVASDLPALRELSGNGESALLFPAGDGASAATSILELIGDPTLVDRLASSGRARTGKFMPEHVADQLVALYHLDLPVDLRDPDATML